MATPTPTTAAQISTSPAVGSPDAKQDIGPRARHIGTRGRPPGSGDGRSQEARTKKDAAATYLQMEEQLDLLVMQAMQLENADLVAELRAARRKVIIMGMEVAQK